MAGLVLKNINKTYENGFEAVKNFSLTIEDKEFIVFVGPSGCGKSTTLRMIAGLEEISSGEMYIGDSKVNDVAPKDRDIAMVFQNYALYPHMTVYENMSFGLKLKKTPKDIMDQKVRAAAKILDIEHLLDRKPKALSGGQRQRVAMGRAIVRHPKVFLMDEPLSNLDAKLRVQMRIEISKLYKDLQTTFIYVTHDQTEAMTLGSRIVVMKDGLVQQIASPKEIYENPVNMFVAGFIGSPQMNFLDGTINDTNKSIKIFESEIPLSDEKYNLLKSKSSSKDVVIGIRPENISVLNSNTKSDNIGTFTAEIDLLENLGSETYIHLSKEEKNIVIKSSGTLDLTHGDNLRFSFNIEKLHVFDKERQDTIF
ncbi:MAG: sn-glycerol-3-phosphate ABC transporter ATP-binding protein UgpC [Clostridium sp.]|uniref:ABC transporter ATP-binding protein n=1 Tax=Clostridium sp. TaxID=1506 RepID=UPI002FC83474